MALLANDACGAPVPFLMCCPWLFFDGKLFHSKLRRAVVAQNLLEMCGNDMQMVFKVVFFYYSDEIVAYIKYSLLVAPTS